MSDISIPDKLLERLLLPNNLDSIHHDLNLVMSTSPVDKKLATFSDVRIHHWHLIILLTFDLEPHPARYALTA